jgi:GT2 family glycosyltransferase/tetratricopeptide (TPR) repeat protein
MTSNKILGLNVIVGPGDEDILDRCLKSCEGRLFDEIVITLGTKQDDPLIREVASKYTDKIYHYVWNEDFGSARNFSFSHNISKYILWLDSDDVIKPENYKALLELKPKLHNWDIIICDYVYSHDENDKPVLVLPRERIVRNCSEIKWHDPIHEYMNLWGKQTRTNIKIDHYRTRAHNPARNIEALRKVYESGDVSERIKFYYGKELSDYGSWDKALPVLESYINDGKDFRDNLTVACIKVSKYYYDKREFDNAKNYALKGIRFNDIYAENYVIVGSIFEHQDNTESAAEYYKEALKKPLTGGMSQLVDYYGFIPSAKLALLYFNKRNYEKALEYCNIALSHKNNNPQMMELNKIIRMELERLSKGVTLKKKDLKLFEEFANSKDFNVSLLKNNFEYCDIRLNKIRKLDVVWYIPVIDINNPSVRIRRYNIAKKMMGMEDVKCRIVTDYHGRNVYEVRNDFGDATVAIFTSNSKYDLELISHFKKSGIVCVFDQCEALFGHPKEKIYMSDVDLVACCSTKLEEMMHERGYMKTVVLKDAVEDVTVKNSIVYENRYEKPRAVYMGMGGNSFLVTEYLKDVIERAGYDLIVISEWDNADIKWDLNTWPDDFSTGDIALCPQRTSIQPAKSEVKVTTAMSLGLPVVASPLPSYIEIIENGKNGFICKSEEEWFSALINLKDPQYRKKIADEAKKTVEEFSIEKISNQWKKTLYNLINGLLQFKKPPENINVKNRSTVDIIIVSYNNVEYLKMCITSILLNTLHPYHIIISDGGSNKETWEYLNTLKGITILGDPKIRKTFSETCNDGIKVSHTKYFVILNSDVIVSKYWLSNLVHKMDTQGRLAACGVLSNCDRGWKFDNPAVNNSPHYDMILNKSGIDLHPGMKIETIKPHIEELYEFMVQSNKKYKGKYVNEDWVAAYATMFARSAINEVGLFDPIYKNGCEDLDLMVRLARYGYKIGQAIDSFVFHFGGVSRGAYELEDMESYHKEDVENHQKYALKWDKQRVVIWTGPAWEPWNKEKVDEGMAGSETWAAYIAREFVKRGYRTTIYNDLLVSDKSKIVLDPVYDDNGKKVGDVIYRDFNNIQSDMEYDVIDYFIASRSLEPFKINIHSLKSYVMIHDIWLSPDKNYDTMQWRIHKYAYLSEWHRQFIMHHHGIPDHKMFLTANGINVELFKDVDSIEKKNQSVYSSSPDRGLCQLLKMLPKIREEVPDFELIVAYGFHNWESMAKMKKDNESLLFIEEIKDLMEQPGVKYVGRVNKKELARYEMESKVWLYPTWFTETHCCIPGTEITAEDERRPIETVRLGDKVLTHTGSLKEVSHIFVRDIDQDIQRIKVKYLMDDLVITGNHDMYILPNDSESLHCVRLQHTPCTKRALKCQSGFKYCKKYRTKEACWKLSESYKQEWIPSEEVKKKDYVIYPKNINKKLPEKFSSYSNDLLLKGRVVAVTNRNGKYIVNKANKIKDFIISNDFLLLCGWYIAKGSFDGKSIVSFSLNINEKEVADFICDYVKKLGLRYWVNEKSETKTLSVNFSSAIMGRFFIDNFGDGAKNKRIPQWVKDLHPDFLKSLIEGILKEDGCKIRDTISIEVASKGLILDLFDSLLKFDCVSSLSENPKHRIIKIKEGNGYIFKRGKKDLLAYKLVCSLNQNIEFFRSIGYVCSKKRVAGQAALQDDKYVYLPVVYNKKEHYKGLVYNLEVKDDNTYVANNITVHNCITAVENGFARNPILSTNLGGLCTTVADSGILLSPEGLTRNGLYPESYIQKFIKEAVKLLKDEEYRKKWADKAYKKMQKYTWDKIADEWINQFEL